MGGRGCTTSAFVGSNRRLARVWRELVGGKLTTSTAAAAEAAAAAAARRVVRRLGRQRASIGTRTLQDSLPFRRQAAARSEGVELSTDRLEAHLPERRCSR